MPHYGYLAVEGPHDVEFVYRLLRPAGFTRIRLYRDLDPFWDPIVPKTFPYRDDLQRRVPVPLFLASSTHSVAIHASQGDSRLIEAIEESLSVLPGPLASIGVMLDADDQRPPAARFQVIRDGVQRTESSCQINPAWCLPAHLLRASSYSRTTWPLVRLKICCWIVLRSSIHSF